MQDPVSYRDPKEIKGECGDRVGHAALNHRVNGYSPQITKTAPRCKALADRSCRMDENYTKVIDVLIGGLTVAALGVVPLSVWAICFNDW